MKIGDGLTGLLVGLLAIAILSISMTFPQQSSYFGPRLFPEVISIGLLLFSAILLARAFRAHTGAGKKRRENFSIGMSSDLKSFRVAIILAMIVGSAIIYIEFLDIVGFQILTAALLFVFYLVLGASAPRALLTSVTATVVFDLVFRVLMHIPLASGFLEGVIYH